MFRYERPQKGRMRQFHQIGVELLGVAAAAGRCRGDRASARRSCASSAFSIARRWSSTRSATPKAATGIAKALVDYLGGHKARLSPDSRDRLERNPLRMLDSKDEGDQQLVANAPLYSDHLNDASRRLL